MSPHLDSLICISAFWCIQSYTQLFYVLHLLYSLSRLLVLVTFLFHVPMHTSVFCSNHFCYVITFLFCIKSTLRCFVCVALIHILLLFTPNERVDLWATLHKVHWWYVYTYQLQPYLSGQLVPLCWGITSTGNTCLHIHLCLASVTTI